MPILIPNYTIDGPDVIEEQFGFEGPEKRLEVHFKSDSMHPAGLRSVSQSEWQQVLDHAKCTIISATSNEYIDSFVLSESSLFVYPNKILLKTCGTTTLLNCIPYLQQVAVEHGSSIEYIIYSRKNYNFPTRQLHPHSVFDDEIHYMNTLFNGKGVVLGPVHKDHWNVYTADFRHEQPQRTSQVFEVMMHDLDPEVMDQFYKKDRVTARMVTENSGIADLIPGSIIDDYQFDPCGYSMNGLFEQWYWTIHITPEPHCSYVSFETNVPFECYNQLLQKVFATFLPGRATVVIRADKSAKYKGAIMSDVAGRNNGYKQTSFNQHKFKCGASAVSCNFLSELENIAGCSQN